MVSNHRPLACEAARERPEEAQETALTSQMRFASLLLRSTQIPGLPDGFSPPNSPGGPKGFGIETIHVQMGHTLNEAQVPVLRWVADGCPDGAMDGSAHRISAAALRSRGLIRVSGRGRTWSATITDAGSAYLASPPPPRKQTPRPTRRAQQTALLPRSLLLCRPPVATTLSRRISDMRTHLSAPLVQQRGGCVPH